MKATYIGKSKLILKYLNFLIDQYQMKFSFQSFEKYRDFWGPIDYYSFYNANGCFTFQNVVQRGEWGLYKSDSFYSEQELLLQTQIKQTDYLQKPTFLFKSFLKLLASSIKEQIAHSGSIFEIPLSP